MCYLKIIGVVLGLMLAASVEAQDKPNLLANGDFAQQTQGWWVGGGDTCKAEIIPADVGGVKQALRLTLQPKAGANPWDIGLMCPVELALKKGTVVRMSAWLRSPQSCQANGIVQLGGPPYTQICVRQVKLSPEWQEYNFQGRCGQDFEPRAASAGFQLAYDPGVIEIAHVVVADLGPSAPD